MNGPYVSAVPITPSDTVSYPQASAIWVGGAGVVALVLPNGTAVNFTATAGTIIPLANIRVNVAGTTATLLVALYC